MKLFKKFPSHSVIHLPEVYPVYHLSDPADVKQAEKNPFGIGRYREKREGMYITPLFGGVRNIHIGIDFFAPVGSPIFSFSDGSIFLFGNNAQEGDYGYTLITEHTFGDIQIYALYGHLSKASLEGKGKGQKIRAGETIAWVGDYHENGNWTPHLHFQISTVRPSQPDMPGVVKESDLEEALLKYPDPRIVLGPVYLD